jgi:hypothetical protein
MEHFESTTITTLKHATRHTSHTTRTPHIFQLFVFHDVDLIPQSADLLPHYRYTAAPSCNAVCLPSPYQMPPYQMPPYQLPVISRVYLPEFCIFCFLLSFSCRKRVHLNVPKTCPILHLNVPPLFHSIVRSSLPAPRAPVHIARVWDRYSGNAKYFGGIGAH